MNSEYEISYLKILKSKCENIFCMITYHEKYSFHDVNKILILIHILIEVFDHD